MKRHLRAGACLGLIGLMAANVAQARTACATPDEISAIQISAVQQNLTDAALGCSKKEVDDYNRFQTVFGPELRKSDALMLRMFKRLKGYRAGNAAYDAYKTRAVAHAELRRIKPGAQADFCKEADIVFAAALAPDKPTLADFVAGIPVEEDSPVEGCQIKVGTSLQGAAALAGTVPQARPALPGDPPPAGLYPP